jgi:hypothetical protein
MYKVEWKNKHKLAGLIRGLKNSNNESVSYGFFEDQGYHPMHPDYTLAEIMAMNELRPSSDPSRYPVFETALAVFGAQFKHNNQIEVKKFIESTATGRLKPVNSMLLAIGQNGIDITKPVFGNTSLLGSNAASTIRAKGKDSPMIDSGFMADNIAARTSLKGFL